MTNATPEQLELARKIADQHRGSGWDKYEECALAAIIETTERAAKLADKRRDDFLSPEYATGQPLSSFSERFACGEISTALRNQEHLKND